MGIRRNILVLPVTFAQGWNLARLGAGFGIVFSVRF